MANLLANLLQAAAKALGAVESIDAVAAQEMTTVLLGYELYNAGSAVVLGSFSVQGKAGKVVAIMNGGGASKTLGLS